MKKSFIMDAFVKYEIILTEYLLKKNECVRFSDVEKNTRSYYKPTKKHKNECSLLIFKYSFSTVS